VRPSFSSRLAWDRPENALATLERARRESGDTLYDLTESNPTRVELPHLGERIGEALAEGGRARYAPAPRGLFAAREAIARETSATLTAMARESSATLTAITRESSALPAMARESSDAGGEARAPELRADQLLLTASSSESYALLFKLLCDPGDAVLVPEPSYPLFEYLARLEGVRPVPYRLAYDGAWHVDFASVDEALAGAAGRARALVVVSPNNPTGSYVKRFELAGLAERCEAHGLAVISDEVFAAYPTGPDDTRAPCLAVEPALAARALTFSLGGLSKACGLPQLKLGWTIVAGPPALAADALSRLELVADTYLSVGAPVQLATPRLLALGAENRRAIAARVAANRARLAAALPAGSPCTLLPCEGGWSAIVRVPATRTDDAWARALLAEDGVLVHPGYFFDLRGGAFLVLSLLPAPETFAEGVRRLVARVGGG
jgi:alanine-synthesizing transaminase